MTGIEIGAIVLCLAIGYWGMSTIINRSPTKKETREQSSQEVPPQQKWQEPPRAEQQEDTSSLDYIRRNWHQILEVPESASKEAIKSAYKQLIGQYHPDKVARLGKDLRELAELKSKQINVAHEYAMLLRR